MTNGMTWSRNPRVAWQVLGGEGVLVHLASGQTVGLNETGGFLWSQLDGTRTVDQLVDLMREAFDEIPSHQVRADVEGFLSNMERSHLILWEPRA